MFKKIILILLLNLFIYNYSFGIKITVEKDPKTGQELQGVYFTNEDIKEMEKPVQYNVLQCIDGDTLVIKDKKTGEEKKVRLLGVDAFETKWNRQAKKQAKKFYLKKEEVISLGKQAKAFCYGYFRGVDVALDCWKKDWFGRELCWVQGYWTGWKFDTMLINAGLGYYVKPY